MSRHVCQGKGMSGARWWLTAMLLVAGLCGVSRAQSVVTVSGLPNGTMPLTEGWRYHAGDDPRWADPNFDDSGWQTVRVQKRTPDVTGFQWYRIHLHLAGPVEPLQVAVLGAWHEVYGNGKLLGGDKGALWLSSFYTFSISPIPVEGRDVVLAVRVHALAYESSVASVALLRRVVLGTPTSSAMLVRTYEASKRLNSLFPLTVDAAIGLAGLAMLWLYGKQPQRSEYRWLAVYLLLLCLADSTYILSYFGLGPSLLNGALSDPMGYLVLVAQVEFIFRFLGKRVTLPWRIYQGVCVMMVPTALVMNLFGLAQNVYGSVEIAITLPATLVLPIVLLIWLIRGNQEAGLLMIPVGLVGATGVLFEFGYILLSVIPSASATYAWMVLPVDFLGFPLRRDNIAHVFFLVALGMVILNRFIRVSRNEARAAAELDAARLMQRKLVPEVLPQVPGLRIEAAYLPATEVGGDFYQVLPQGEATVVVVGDVSGKGLRAAMKGTLTIGALRALAQTGLDPAELLTALNTELVQSDDGGFVTCLCLRIEADGHVVMANAGHLAPYLDGVEVAMEPGLPLGMGAGVQYARTEIDVKNGQRLTLISDGVVEARNAGGELYGFERTERLSRSSAETIAATALGFGQEDDITALVLEWAVA